MCFGCGKNDKPGDEELPHRPAQGQAYQHGYSMEPMPTASAQHQQHNDYAPPSGPPPSRRPEDDRSYIKPPPGPPPSAPGSNPRPQHDWEMAVPDTSLFPPPPNIFSGWDRSPAFNATEEEAEAGERWCAEHPLVAPVRLDAGAVAALNAHNLGLMQPPCLLGTLVWAGKGVWKASTDAKSPDSCIVAYPPLYSAVLHSGLPRKTIYYEVQLDRAASANPPRGEICLAIGFVALPYPPHRLPGWHRGSLAVHGDDGHRYVNDRWGGRSFTQPFAPGERLGVGMTFTNNTAAAAAAVDANGKWAASSSLGGGGRRIETQVFFTRQGVEVGRWDLHEETDAEQDLPVTGLEGHHDLTCAIGTCGKLQFEVLLAPEKWLCKPEGY